MVNSGAQEGRVVGVNAIVTEPVDAGAESIHSPLQSPCLVPEQSRQQQTLEDAVLDQIPSQLEMFNQLREMQSRMKSAEEALVDCKRGLERRSSMKRVAEGPSGPSKKHKGDKGKSKVDDSVHWCWRCRFKHSSDCTKATQRCGHCGELGHIFQECKNEVKCFNCGGKGHMSTACSKEKNIRKKGDKKALNCAFQVFTNEVQESYKKLKGSTQRKNDNSDREAKWCDRCKNKHLGECSASTRRCLNCRKLGHISRDCNEGPRCYNCQEMGHISAMCPSKRVGEKKSDPKDKSHAFQMTAEENDDA